MFNSSSTNRNLSFPPPPHPFLGHEGHQDIFSFCQYYNNTDLLVSDLSSANFTNFDSISSPPLPPVAPPPPPPPPPLVVQRKTTTMSATRTTKGQDCEDNLGFPKKKKQGKTDRHSKICTAQGPRDRRVRLSIGIARKFFDLQDMLGFDKASKTIDWLLSKSKEAIDELSDECCNFEDDDEEEEEKLKKAADSSSCSTKESRAKARARARERTIEKLSSKDSDLKKQTNCGQNWEIPGTSSRSSYRDITEMNLSPPGTHLGIIQMDLKNPNIEDIRSLVYDLFNKLLR